MRYPLSYRKFSPGMYAVYCDDKFIGEVRRLGSSWSFRTFYEPVFYSPVLAPTRYLAVVQWHGLAEMCDSCP